MLAPISLILVCLIAPVWSRTSKQRAPSCEVLKRVTLSFYGKSDSPDRVAYSECGRLSAGGVGSFDNPLTMASAPGLFTKCEVVFVPYLLKYVRFEDICTECVKDYAKDRFHMQIWTGTEKVAGRENSLCERDLAPTYGMAIIRHPGPDYRLDSTPLYSSDATNVCRLDHRYSLLNNEVFCYGRKGKSLKSVSKAKSKAKSKANSKSKASSKQAIDEGWGLVQDSSSENGAQNGPFALRLPFSSNVQHDDPDESTSQAGWKLVEDPISMTKQGDTILPPPPINTQEDTMATAPLQSTETEGWSLVEDSPAALRDFPERNPNRKKKAKQSSKDSHGWKLKEDTPKDTQGWKLVEDTELKIKYDLSNLDRQSMNAQQVVADAAAL